MVVSPTKPDYHTLDFSNVYHFICVWPTALKLGCISNFDMLFLVMGFISLVDEIQFMLISSLHICMKVYRVYKMKPDLPIVHNSCQPGVDGLGCVAMTVIQTHIINAGGTKCETLHEGDMRKSSLFLNQSLEYCSYNQVFSNTIQVTMLISAHTHGPVVQSPDKLTKD